MRWTEFLLGYGLKIVKLKAGGRTLEMVGIWASWEVEIDLLLAFIIE